MKIKLIYPPENNSVQSHLLPLGLGHIMGFLKSMGVYAEADDLHNKVIKNNLNLSKLSNLNEIQNYIIEKHNDFDEISKNILSLTNLNGFDLIGFSVTDQSQVNILLVLAKYIKKTLNSKILVGGSFSNNFEEFQNKYRLFDYIVLNEGELAFKDIIDNSLNTTNKLISNTIYYEKGSKRIGPSVETPINLKKMPNFDGLDMSLYTNDSLSKPIIPYQFIFGCPFNCNFCSGHAKLRYKSPKVVAEELSKLSKTYNSNYFYFLHNTLNFSDNYLKKVCEEILKLQLNLIWTDSIRPTLFDEDLIKLLYKSGCRKLTIGIDSGSDDLLERMNRLIKVSDVEKTVALLSKYNIWIHVNFMVGYILESKNDLELTYALIKRLERHLSTYTISKFMLLPNSNIYNNPLKHGIEILSKTKNSKDTNEYNEYAFDEINNLNWEQKKKQQEFAFKIISFALKKLDKYGLMNNLDQFYSLVDKYDNDRIKINKILFN